MLTKQDKTYINDLLDRRFEELAIMIQNGFAEILDKKADKIDLNEMEDRIDSRMCNLEAKINTIEFKLITAPSNRLDKIEDDIRQIKSKFGLI